MDNNDSIRLYHYTKVDTLLRYILPQMRLRMNALANTNDPTEALWPLLEQDFTLEHPVYDKLSLVKSLSFCFHRINIEPPTPIFGYGIHPMWAHYAENWSGVCLDINYDKLIENNGEQISRHDIRHHEIRYVRSVNRKDIPPKYLMQFMIDDKAMDSHEYVSHLIQNEGFVDDRFFKKDLSWSYEQEYRFVALNDFEEDIYLKLNGAIREIILGPRFNLHLYPAVRELVQEHGLNVDIIRKGNVDVRGCSNEWETYESYYNDNRISTKKRKIEEMTKKFLDHIIEYQKPQIPSLHISGPPKNEDSKEHPSR